MQSVEFFLPRLQAAAFAQHDRTTVDAEDATTRCSITQDTMESIDKEDMLLSNVLEARTKPKLIISRAWSA
ncbi:hypothetical protein GUITHDRAFT_153509 [Guillardia theta CCMP2712]|uniref:Uncharacterized protein n=1 Tax=Guillardia theta (strain CCMP2712) TaxID=905079 RepID=L1J3F5_GUITC|nr:hypothetical protein GUITHDRAFT_153509 [Guillardia theta CCMP2712]EKX42669.1 hypothetical protein GUITHDRAFT_153509 [Guillardia theta CCMP2712]|eukprot:XP_005829649.1 hypothetical protein GUITHDRAFT_153509 [Guillardia theta CCMP2712]